jgi:hypothetical protein
MGKISKTFALFLILLIVMSCLTLLLVKPANAQTATPSSTNSLSFSSGLTIFSPLNQTYASNVIPLNVTFNWVVATQVFLNYSIDGNNQGQLPLDFGNITGFQQTYLAYGLVDLPQLSNGSHVLTVNVESRLNGNGEPYYWVNQVYFSISSRQPTPSPAPTLSPTVPEFSWLAIVPLLLSLFPVAVILRYRKTANLKQ